MRMLTDLATLFETAKPYLIAIGGLIAVVAAILTIFVLVNQIWTSPKPTTPNLAMVFTHDPSGLPQRVIAIPPDGLRHVSDGDGNLTFDMYRNGQSVSLRDPQTGKELTVIILNLSQTEEMKVLIP